MKNSALSKLSGRPEPGDLTEEGLREIICFLQEKLQEVVSVKLSIDESPVVELHPVGFCAQFQSIRESPGAMIDPMICGTIGLQDNGDEGLCRQIAATIHFRVNDVAVVTHEREAFLELKFNIEQERWEKVGWRPDEFGEFDLR